MVHRMSIRIPKLIQTARIQGLRRRVKRASRIKSKSSRNSRIIQNGRHERLVTLAFTGSIGMTLIILACAMPDEKVWWPFFVVLFYVLAPMPTILARRYTEHTGSSSSSVELAIFLTMGFVVSSFALPIVLARSPDPHAIITWTSCNLTLGANVIVYLTYIGFFVTLYQEDSDYSMW